VIASKGYPGSYPKGLAISGLDAAAAKDEAITVFHAGTKLDGDSVVTSGGRVLAVTGVGSDLKEAVGKAYSGVGEISFADDGAQYRTDIAYQALQ
jgi:phosphoribosylamine---glycine ligase